MLWGSCPQHALPRFPHTSYDENNKSVDSTGLTSPSGSSSKCQPGNSTAITWQQWPVPTQQSNKLATVPTRQQHSENLAAAASTNPAKAPTRQQCLTGNRTARQQNSKNSSGKRKRQLGNRDNGISAKPATAPSRQVETRQAQTRQAPTRQAQTQQAQTRQAQTRQGMNSRCAEDCMLCGGCSVCGQVRTNTLLCCAGDFEAKKNN